MEVEKKRRSVGDQFIIISIDSIACIFAVQSRQSRPEAEEHIVNCIIYVIMNNYNNDTHPIFATLKYICVKFAYISNISCSLK